MEVTKEERRVRRQIKSISNKLVYKKVWCTEKGCICLNKYAIILEINKIYFH